MRIAVLSANLGNFDTETENFSQETPDNVESVMFHRFTDDNFPPCVGYTPRMQYRIPKLFGWQMFPGYDVYIWLDGSFSMQNTRSVRWFFHHLGDADMAVFRHPYRKTIKEEVDHIEDHLQKGKPYITARYKGGLHKEQYEVIKKNYTYTDDHLYTSTAFIYRSYYPVWKALEEWWTLQSRYFTCDQIAMPYALRSLKINVIDDNQYKIPFLTLTSKHK